jgi:hypothetical protein
VLLAANVGFLAIPGLGGQNNNNATNSNASAAQSSNTSSAGQIFSLLSMISSLGSIIIGLLLVRQRRRQTQLENSNCRVRSTLFSGVLDICHSILDLQPEYLEYFESMKFGVDLLAIMYSLPYVFLLWA